VLQLQPPEESHVPWLLQFSAEVQPKVVSMALQYK
jgi:hypothetical protein